VYVFLLSKVKGLTIGPVNLHHCQIHPRRCCPSFDNLLEDVNIQGIFNLFMDATTVGFNSINEDNSFQLRKYT